MTGHESKRAAAQDNITDEQGRPMTYWGGKAQPAQGPVGGTREAFEKWAKTFPNYIDITRFENGYSDSDTNYAWIAWQAALAQPALEPVAWMYPDALCDRACLYVCTKAFTQFPECATAPPQRPWVGLTEEEIQPRLNGLPTQSIAVYARSIEAILKEKNNGT